jgi:hypothetical protein
VAAVEGHGLERERYDLHLHLSAVRNWERWRRKGRQAYL